MLTTSGERVALDAPQVAWQRAQIRIGGAVGELWRFWSRISGGDALGTNADWMAASRTANSVAQALFDAIQAATLTCASESYTNSAVAGIPWLGSI